MTRRASVLALVVLVSHLGQVVGPGVAHASMRIRRKDEAAVEPAARPDDEDVALLALVADVTAVRLGTPLLVVAPDAPATPDGPAGPDERAAPTEPTAPASPGLFADFRHYAFHTYPRRVLLVALETVKPRSLIVLGLAGAAVPLLSNDLDEDVEAARNGMHREPEFVRIGLLTGNAGVLLGSSLVLAVGGRLGGSERFTRTGTTLLETLPVIGLETELLKRTVRRERPDGSDRLSFPSGHTSVTFAVATVLADRLGWLAGAPAFFAAGLVGASRIEGNRHHFTDVLFGAVLGTVVGLSALRVRDREERAAGPGKISVGMAHAGVAAIDLPGADAAASIAASSPARREWHLGVSPLAVGRGGGVGVTVEW